MTKDDRIVFRVFQYGFQHAAKYIQKDEDGLSLPQPVILYFDTQKNISAYQTMAISVGNMQSLQYDVRTFCYQDYSIKELNERNMILLIPFQLLKYRDMMNRNPSRENIQGLKKLIADDILGSIQRSYEAGDIYYSDVVILKDMSRMLCEFLYGENKACQEEGVTKMLAEPIIFESVVLRDHYEDLIQELKEKQKEELAELYAENARLRAQLAEIK